MATKCAINGRQWGAYDGRRHFRCSMSKYSCQRISKIASSQRIRCTLRRCRRIEPLGRSNPVRLSAGGFGAILPTRAKPAAVLGWCSQMSQGLGGYGRPTINPRWPRAQNPDRCESELRWKFWHFTLWLRPYALRGPLTRGEGVPPVHLGRSEGGQSTGTPGWR